MRHESGSPLPLCVTRAPRLPFICLKNAKKITPVLQAMFKIAGICCHNQAFAVVFKSCESLHPHLEVEKMSSLLCYPRWCSFYLLYQE